MPATGSIVACAREREGGGSGDEKVPLSLSLSLSFQCPLFFRLMKEKMTFCIRNFRRRASIKKSKRQLLESRFPALPSSVALDSNSGTYSMARRLLELGTSRLKEMRDNSICFLFLLFPCSLSLSLSLDLHLHKKKKKKTHLLLPPPAPEQTKQRQPPPSSSSSSSSTRPPPWPGSTPS